MKPLFVVRCQIMALMLDFIWKTHTKGYITLGMCVWVDGCSHCSKRIMGTLNHQSETSIKH